MNLFKSEMISQIEKNFIDNMNISSFELMERAAQAFVLWLLDKTNKQNEFLVVCGPGNNGADGLLIASKLESYGFIVKILMVGDPAKRTTEFNAHLKSVSLNRSISIHEWSHDKPQFNVTLNIIIIDAILGIGVNRPLEGQFKMLIDSLNGLNNPIYSVDVPSGMDCNNATKSSCIKAVATLAFQWPKISFFHKENEDNLGDWAFESIGISDTNIPEPSSDIQLITRQMVKDIIPIRLKNTHKGSYGHVGLMTGACGMSGAAILCATAALKMGVGLCTVISEECNRIIIQSNLSEAIFSNIQSFKISESVTYAIGPGLGKSTSALKWLANLLDHINYPILLDADALNLLSENKYLWDKIPKNSILTPHPKEFERLFGISSDSFDRLQLQSQMSMKHQVIIVLKDHNTTITAPNGRIYYNNTGNPGMATGGSGDVLTGIITSLLAQKTPTLDSAVAGVYIHGLAADIAVEDIHMMSLTPSDIINHLSKALKSTTD